MKPRYFFATESWKKTAAGTDIALFASHPLNELQAEKPILLMGGIHGDEPEGVALAEGIRDWLCQESTKPTSGSGTGSGTGSSTTANSTPNFTHKAQTLVPWIVIPCLNVDGYRAATRGNSRGVDLNRNYPSQDWTSVATKPRYNPGPSPGSELEIQGVVELIRQLHPRLIIHCHSWDPMIVATGALSRPDAQKLAQASGYKMVDEIGYPTPGSLSRYAWHDHGIPVICIEEQEHLKDLSVVWPRFAPGLKAIFQDHSPRSQNNSDHQAQAADDDLAISQNREISPSPSAGQNGKRR